MKKSLTKKFLVSILTLAFAVVCLGTSTFAWFAMNNKVTATGMEVKAATDGNLVINKNAKVPQNSTDIETSFAGEAFEIKPMTCAEEWDGWKIPSDGTLTDQHTGYNDGVLTAISSGEWKQSSKVVPGGTYDIGYYKDYIVWIASAGEKLTNKDIEVVLSIDVLDELYKGALAVSFYLGTAVDTALTVTQTTEPDATVWLKDFMKDDADEINANAEPVVIGNFAEIPSCADDAHGVEILMRVWFDGDLNAIEPAEYYTPVTNPDASEVTSYYEANGVDAKGVRQYKQVEDASTFDLAKTYYVQSSATVKYINSDNIPVDSLTLTVKFTAVDPE